MNEVSISLENLDKSTDGFLLEFHDGIQGIVIKKKDNFIIISAVVKDPSVVRVESA